MADNMVARTHLIVMLVVVAMGAAYLIFLAATWNELQKHRAASFAKIDAILDRMPPAKTEVAKDDG
jgi:hypothetical protein